MADKTEFDLVDEAELKIARLLKDMQAENKKVTDGVCIVAMSRTIRSLLNEYPAERMHDIKQRCALMFTHGIN